VLVIPDGAPGLIGAVEQVFPCSLRQRCLVHRARNLLAKVPTHAQAEVKAAFWQIFDDIDQPPARPLSTRQSAAPPPSPTATRGSTRPRLPALPPRLRS
jgi:transposase-like protein